MLPKVPIAPYGLRAPSQGREHRTAPQRPTLVPTGGHEGAGQFEQAAWAAPPPALLLSTDTHLTQGVRFTHTCLCVSVLAEAV